jgi:hypothetical protein
MWDAERTNGATMLTKSSPLTFLFLFVALAACSSKPAGGGAAGSSGTTGVAGTTGGAGTAGAAGTITAGTMGAAGASGSTGGAAGASGSTGGAGVTAGGAGTMGAAGASAGGVGGAGGAGASAPATLMPGVTWQWQLSGTVDTTVDAHLYDIDLFDNPTSTIASLHTAGRIVICYFSAGSYEPGRPDSAQLAATGLGKTLAGWPNEKWLDVRLPAVRAIMSARFDTAKGKGCDGVEPDNVDGYDNDNGLGLTMQDQLDYDNFLASEGHARGLSVGLKNALGLVPALVSKFDWALNEECLKYNECDALAPFVAAGKAVLHCEYATAKTGICDKDPAGFSTIIKNLNLDAFRLTCP